MTARRLSFVLFGGSLVLFLIAAGIFVAYMSIAEQAVNKDGVEVVGFLLTLAALGGGVIFGFAGIVSIAFSLINRSPDRFVLLDDSTTIEGQ